MNNQERGKILKRLGMNRALKNADPDWIGAVYWSFQQFNELNKDSFTADDVRSLLDAQGVETRNPMALGSIFSDLARRGVIAKVPGEQRISKRAETHNRPQTVWRFTSDIDEDNPREYAKKTALQVLHKYEPKTKRDIARALYRACLRGMRWKEFPG